jgi:hypothetical protein
MGKKGKECPIMKTDLTIFSIIFSMILSIVDKTRMKRLFYLILFSIPAFQPAGGLASAQTTYYISSSGNNVNNGTSISTPWKTVDKIYAGSFQPGDSILLKRGDVFEGQIMATLYGSTISPIVIASYGTGEKPIIYGDMRGVTWTKISGRTGYYKAYIGKGSVVPICYQWVYGVWEMYASSDYRNDNPSEWESWLNSLAIGCFGISSTQDSLFVHTYGNVTFPATRDSIRIYRIGSNLAPGSHDVIIRDLDLRCGYYALEVDGSSNIIVRNIYTRNNISGSIYLESTVNSLIDSCYMDTVGNTSLYFNCATNCKMKYNTVVNVLTTVDGIPCTGDLCGIGVQGAFGDAFEEAGYGYNTVEYNTLDNIADAMVDFWYNTGDTIRYNTGTNLGGGVYPHGTNLMINGNSSTLRDNAGSDGMNCANVGTGVITVTGNTFIGAKSYAMWIENTSTGTIVISNNLVTGYDENTDFVWIHGSGITSDSNTFYGLGRWGNSADQSVWYSTLSDFQTATGYETGSVWYSSLDSMTNVHSESTRPTKIELEQNYPNPFNPSTVINYQLSVAGKVRLSVYDMLGREIAILVDGEKGAGNYSETFDGSKLSSGIYLTRFIFNPEKGKQILQVKKMLLIK